MVNKISSVTENYIMYITLYILCTVIHTQKWSSMKFCNLNSLCRLQNIANWLQQ